MVTSTPRRSQSEIPVPDDIRRNLLRILSDLPRGVIVHDLPDLYLAKFKRELPTFLVSVKSMIEFLYCLSDDVKVKHHVCGTVSVKLCKYVDNNEEPPPLPISNSVASRKNKAVQVIKNILLKRPKGIFLTRLRFEYFKETGEVIPLKRMGVVSERELIATMSEHFNLCPFSEPGTDVDFIVTSAVVLDNSD
jgi:hypothetical protein